VWYAIIGNQFIGPFLTVGVSLASSRNELHCCSFSYQHRMFCEKFFSLFSFNLQILLTIIIIIIIIITITTTTMELAVTLLLSV
jgi:hypothetical protein